VWDATAQELFDLTVVTLTVLRRMKCNVDKSSVGVISTVKVKVNVKQSLDRPGQTLRTPGGWGSQNFYTISHMKLERLSAFRTGRLYPPEHIPDTHFCSRLIVPQGQFAAGRIKSIKNLNDPIVTLHFLLKT